MCQSLPEAADYDPTIALRATAKTASAHRDFDAWRARRTDEKLLGKLGDSELELDEAYARYTVALEDVQTRPQRPRRDSISSLIGLATSAYRAR